MVEYIEREAAYPLAKKICDAIDSKEFRRLNFGMRILDWIDDLPAADARPVVKGFNKLKDYPTLFECSACGWECDDTMPGDTATYNFCPNCGAEMEES